MKVSQIGQFGLINKIGKLIEDTCQPQSESWQNLRMGLGDDCAVWQGERTCYLSKVDSQLQGIHFTLDLISWRDLGWKALAVNLSDIAAMGGRPLYALVSLGLPFETEVENVMALYQGILELAAQTGTAVIGGHISASPNLYIDVQITGRTETPDGVVLSRSAAQPGDLIAVTGSLGSAAAGLKILKEKLTVETVVLNYLKAAFTHPEPRLAEGALLLESGVRCAIDISDGLIADLGRIGESSELAAEIETEKLPIRAEVKSAFGDKALDLALSGGEDYQLLFTASSRVIEAVKQNCSYPVTVIGKITTGPTGQITLIENSGKRSSPTSAGWDHFKRIEHEIT
jgi:thiamine-monophosphate kinase